MKPPEKAYTVVALTPGAHNINVNWPWDAGWPDLTFKINVETGKPLYLKISGDFGRMSSGDYRLESSAQEISEPFAEPEISACCRYITPLTAE